MTRLRIAMIGAGGFARRHLEVLEARPDVAVVGHQARRLEAAERQAQRFGGRAFDEIDALLDACTPDAVWIVLPPGAHGPPELACLARDVPFFVEKPLAADHEPAERIAAEVARRGAVTAVGYHWRALDLIPAAREALEGRELRLVRGSWHDATPAPAWWRRRDESGGQMVEQATHVLDLARHLIGEADVACALAPVVPRDGFPDADVAVASAALLRYERGPIGVFSATCALAGPAEIELTLYAEGRRIVLTQARLHVDDGGSERVLHARRDPVAYEDDAFLEAVRTSDPRRPIVSYGDAIGTHRLSLAVRGAGDERGDG